MIRQVKTENETYIYLADQPLGSGGEGQVFSILEPAEFRDFVVKIYFPNERDIDKLLKIKYLKDNRPNLQNDFSVIWVNDLVFENDEFVGFLMPKVQSGIDLTYLCSLQISEKLPQEWHQKYGRSTIQGLINRTKICYNLAAALSQIHQTGKYVLVDLKPENIKIQINGQISLLDLDSIQIIDNESVIFPAKKLSLEYSPAERIHLSLNKDYIPETWDRFSIAVVFYKILFGLHPFAATAKGELSNLVSHEQKILAGLFAHGQRKDDLLVVPKPHDNFNALPFSVKNLFTRAFDEGFLAPSSRPSASEWCNGLQKIEPIVQNYHSPFVKPIKPKATKNENPAPVIRKTNYFVYGMVILFITIIFISVRFVSFLGRMEQFDSNGKRTKNLPEIAIQSENGGQSRNENPADGLDEKFKTQDFLPEWKNTVDKFRQTSEKIKTFKDGTIKFKKAGKWGYADEFGEIFMACEYDTIGDFQNNNAIFKRDGKVGIIDRYLRVRFSSDKYEDIGNFNDGLMPIKNKMGKWGYLNLAGFEIIAFEYDEADSFREGSAWVSKNRNRFAIDEKGSCVLDCP